LEPDQAALMLARQCACLASVRRCPGTLDRVRRLTRLTPGDFVALGQEYALQQGRQTAIGFLV